MIVARSLTKDYGDKRAVDELSFTVRPGVVTGFLGPNGSGKSTTMRLILGLDAPTKGETTVNGKRYRDHAAPLHEVGALLEAQIRPHWPLGLQPPSRSRADTRHSPFPRQRADRPRRSAGRRAETSRHVLARDGAAARNRVRAARRSSHGDARRAGQRPRSGGDSLDAQPPPWTGGRGPHGLRLLAPDERDGVDRRSLDRRRPRPLDRGHEHRSVPRAGLRQRRSRSLPPRRAAPASCSPAPMSSCTPRAGGDRGARTDRRADRRRCGRSTRSPSTS